MLAFIPGARPLGMLFIIGFAINFAGIPVWLLQRRNGRRIAAEMRDAAPPVAVFTGAPIAVAPATPSVPASPGELVILLYENDDLPVAGPFRDLLTANANIVGQPPCRFLYLYNFFADAISTKLRPTAGWGA
jgi:hypothetical protein